MLLTLIMLLFCSVQARQCLCSTVCGSISKQGHSHQNLSGQVEIILQGSTSSDSKSLLLCTACIAYYRGVGTGPADPGTA